MSNLIEAVAICDAKGATFVDRMYDTKDGKMRLYAGFQRLSALRDAVVYLQKSGVADHIHTLILPPSLEGKRMQGRLTITLK